jgi:hypothetical protein
MFAKLYDFREKEENFDISFRETLENFAWVRSLDIVLLCFLKSKKNIIQVHPAVLLN